MHSVLLCLVSVASFWPVVYFLKRQEGFKMGSSMFNQVMLYAIMAMTVCHFLAEQKSLEAYSFIPLRNWHKLINVFLLIQQCSVVLFLGELPKHVESTLFSLNLILILIMQEKDEVKGEIKYSMIPLGLNNLYLLLTNLKNYSKAGNQEGGISITSPSSPSSSQINYFVVNKAKVAYGMMWYAGSLIGYCLMEKFNQGLDLKTSQEMFFFTASETVFMVSMAMSYFFSYQTYAVDRHMLGNTRENLDKSKVVVGVEIREVAASFMKSFVEQLPGKMHLAFQPVTHKAESILKAT